MVLTDGKKGDVFNIINIDLEKKVKTRLQDMGLTQGARIKILSYYSNNAYVINIRGSRVVIGKDIANRIIVSKVDCENCSKRTINRVNKVS